MPVIVFAVARLRHRIIPRRARRRTPLRTELRSRYSQTCMSSTPTVSRLQTLACAAQATQVPASDMARVEPTRPLPHPKLSPPREFRRSPSRKLPHSRCLKTCNTRTPTSRAWTARRLPQEPRRRDSPHPTRASNHSHSHATTAAAQRARRCSGRSGRRSRRLAQRPSRRSARSGGGRT